MNKTNISKFVFTTALLLMFSGCGTEEENTETTTSEKIIKTVPVITLEQKPFQPTVSLSGTIKANEEANIASEIVGTIGEVLVEEGETVAEGQLLMKLEAANNSTQAAYNTALVSFENARKTLELQKISTQKTVENAELQLQQSEIQLKTSLDSKQFSTGASTSQRITAEKNLEIEKKNLEIAKTALQNTLINEEKTKENLMESSSNTISTSLVSFRNSLTDIDKILGISKAYEDYNDSYEAYLGAKDSSLIYPTTSDWHLVSNSFEDLENRYNTFLTLEEGPEKDAEIQNLLTDISAEAQKLKSLLRNTESILKNSISSSTFSESALDALRSQNTVAQNSLEQSVATLDTTKQSISDFFLQSPQRIQNAELNVQVAENRILSNSESIETLKNQESLQEVSSESNVALAQKSVDSAQKNFESAKAQADIALQGAQSQYDSAKAALDQALVNISKLQIKAGRSGTISNISKDTGESVSPGTPLITISDFSSLKLVGDVSVSESFLLSKGDKATIEINGIEEIFNGEIKTVFPDADPVTRRVRIDIDIPNQENIPANVFAEGTVFLPAEEETIFIPFKSLVSQNPPTIFIIKTEDEKKIAEKKEIETGRKNGELIELKTPLRPGAFIIPEKIQGLKNGDEVEIEVSSAEIGRG